MAARAPESSADLQITTEDIPSYFIDGIVGTAWANGVCRVMLGQYVVDPTPGAEFPKVKHVVQLMMTTEGVREFIDQLRSIPGVNSDA